MKWHKIPGFENYSINRKGQVRNDKRNHIMALRVNKDGVVHVSLSKDGRQYVRGIALLVAKTYLDVPQQKHFNSVIHLDGDRSNNDVDNLQWRPRWFTLVYHKQFENMRGYNKPIRDRKSGEEFESSWDAVMKYGLLHAELIMSMYNRTYVWPTYQEFEVIEN